MSVCVTVIAKSVAGKNPYFPKQDWEDLVQEVRLYQARYPERTAVFKFVMIDFLRTYTPLWRYRGREETKTEKHYGLIGDYDTMGNDLKKALTVDGRKEIEVRELKRIVDKIKNKEWRKIIKLLYFEGKSLKEIAKLLGCNSANVYQKKERGLKELRKLYNINEENV